MSGAYLYAVLGLEPAGDPPRGLRGEALRFLACASGLVAAWGEAAAPPAATAAAVRAHDATVRRLVERAPAVLPARFGQWFADGARIAAALDERAAAFAQALERVAGCEQMTLRVFAPAAPPRRGRAAAGAPDVPRRGESGAVYLAARRAAHERAAELPEIAALRARLAPLVRAERCARGGRAPLLGSVYHLVARGGAGEYLRALDSAPLPPGVTVAASGPWAPYAFSPEVAA